MEIQSIISLWLYKTNIIINSRKTIQYPSDMLFSIIVILKYIIEHMSLKSGTSTCRKHIEISENNLFNVSGTILFVIFV